MHLIYKPNLKTITIQEDSDKIKIDSIKDININEQLSVD